jgi:gamma-glutamyltranspeptidase/glutathione hydrolase
VQVLERGGNAVDAAIAPAPSWAWSSRSRTASAATCSRSSTTADRASPWLNAHGWTPRELTLAFLKTQGLTEMPPGGIHTVTVPGAVAGWRVPRAARHAADGGPSGGGDLVRGRRVSGVGGHRGTLGVLTAKDRRLEGASHTYLPGGRAPRAGEVFRNPDLAASLRLIAAHGRAGFYEGRTADAILAISDEQGGTMAAADLAEFEPEWVVPISTTYRGWTVYELPPSTQGIAALMMLNLMEAFPLADYGFHSARALHVMIEAKKLAYADMLRYVGDLVGRCRGAMLDKALAGPRQAHRRRARADASSRRSSA